MSAMRLFLDGKLDEALCLLDETVLLRRKSEAEEIAAEVSRNFLLRRHAGSSGTPEE